MGFGEIHAAARYRDKGEGFISPGCSHRGRCKKRNFGSKRSPDGGIIINV
jgi:hypothetical protein